ncbi:hypothetical protein QG516_21245 [Pedobacter gandavensis]|uniref:hypothetical protein n=1 Tax=Pedobacter TaxID=84567 RepID=UPI001C990AB9|nr:MULTISPECIES: hypothetical protein [Pedobacter]WGQ09040.1 hypothetical protein QG516_21245 [Pedobacter gandavensis]|eukprot:gene15556-18776_t
MDALITKLESLNSATKRTVDLLKTLFIKTEFKKGWMFGNGTWQSVPMLYYISSGLVRGSVEFKEDSYTLWMLENGFLIPSNGFLSQKGTSETIEFLKPTQAYILNLMRAEKLAKEDLNLYKMLLEIYEGNLLDGRKRELMLRIPNAKNRLEYFKMNNPELEKVMTDEHLAQMLRIDKKYYYSVKKAR